MGKKGKKYHYGSKEHVATDTDGFIFGVHTVAANQYAGASLPVLMDQLLSAHAIQGVGTAKGYVSKANSAYLSKRKLRNRLQRKAGRHRPLTVWEKGFNRGITQIRYVEERTFGSCKRWFAGGIARYKGLAKVHTGDRLQP